MAEEKKTPWVLIIVAGSALATLTTLIVKHLWDKFIKKEGI